MGKKTFQILLLILLVFLISCEEEDSIIEPEPIQTSSSATYIHLAHTRTSNNIVMDSIVASLDYSKYDLLLLGGDLMQYTSQDEATLEYVDGIFDLRGDRTLLALGNHDYTDLALYKTVIGKPAFYSYSKNNITFLVLDTQDSSSSVTYEQLEMLNETADTITSSKHLVLLHHKLIWMRDHPELEQIADLVSNGGIGNCSYCINANNFYTDVYPILLKVKNKGINVICVGGDIGFKKKNFEYITDEGIYFLASGIDTGDSLDQALLFEHDLTNDKLSWRFELLSDL